MQFRQSTTPDFVELAVWYKCKHSEAYIYYSKKYEHLVKLIILCECMAAICLLTMYSSIELIPDICYKAMIGVFQIMAFFICGYERYMRFAGLADDHHNAACMWQLVVNAGKCTKEDFDRILSMCVRL